MVNKKEVITGKYTITVQCDDGFADYVKQMKEYRKSLTEYYSNPNLPLFYRLFYPPIAPFSPERGLK